MVKAGRNRHWTERFQWPLAFGVIVLLVEVLVPEHRRAVARRKADVMLGSAVAEH
jgi:hypothetical protein